MSPRDLLRLALDLPYPLRVPTITPSSSFALRPDNPFLVSYVAYHHYRSLGWVVKTGLKFCVDWLLYKRGLVFSHAEYVIVTPSHHVHATVLALLITVSWALSILQQQVRIDGHSALCKQDTGSFETVYSRQRRTHVLAMA